MAKTKKSEPTKNSYVLRLRAFFESVLVFLNEYKFRFLIGVGVLFILFYGARILYLQQQRHAIIDSISDPGLVQELEDNNVEEIVSEIPPTTPARIVMPDTGVDEEIVVSQITDGRWVMEDESANYLDTSAMLNAGSNTVIYGHNHPTILGNMRNAKKGQSVLIYDDNGDVWEYVVTDTKVVNPDQIQYLLPTDGDQITVYTCYDLFATKRFILIAKPV